MAMLITSVMMASMTHCLMHMVRHQIFEWHVFYIFILYDIQFVNMQRAHRLSLLPPPPPPPPPPIIRQHQGADDEVEFLMMMMVRILAVFLMPHIYQRHLIFIINYTGCPMPAMGTFSPILARKASQLFVAHISAASPRARYKKYRSLSDVHCMKIIF